MKPIVLIAVAVALALACDAKTATGPQVGTVTGTFTSSQGGVPLANVNVSLAADQAAFTGAATSGADGKWTVGGVPIGTGTVTIDSLSLPVGCAKVAPFGYVMPQTGATTRFTLVVAC